MKRMFLGSALNAMIAGLVAGSARVQMSQENLAPMLPDLTMLSTPPMFRSRSYAVAQHGSSKITPAMDRRKAKKRKATVRARRLGHA